MSDSQTELTTRLQRIESMLSTLAPRFAALREKNSDLVAENNRLRAEIEAMNHMRARELRDMATQIAPHVAKVAVAEARDMREMAKRGIMKRQASRAGMTLAAWICHCVENDHDPLKMDKTIANHEKPSKRGGRPRKIKTSDPIRERAEALADMAEEETAKHH